MDRKTIFFFDGVCGLCNSSVNFILKHDKQGVFTLAALQDPKALAFLKQAGQPAPDFSTSILFHEGRFYTKSDGYFAIMKILGLPWSLVVPLRFVPRFLRDFFYDIVAANRYRIFGKLETCRVPTPEEKSRFL